MRRRQWPRAFAIGAMLMLMLASVSCSQTRYVPSAAASNLTIAATATNFTENYNFLSPTNSFLPPGSDLMYEPLISVSPATNYIPKPWLAKSWSFSDDGKVLTFDLRPDVTWSDGERFTARDVAFTLGLAQTKKYALGNPGDITQVLTPDETTVVVHLEAPGFAALANYANIKIVPEHLWRGQDPATFTNPDPVGTGPFAIQTFGIQRISYQLRDDYWRGGGNGVRSVTYLAKANPSSVWQSLVSGESDYAESPLIGNPGRTFVALDPDLYHFWQPAPGSSQGLRFNAQAEPTNDVHVRRALSAAINAGQLVTLTPGNYPQEAANVTGFAEPAQTPWIAPEFRGRSQTQDPAAARAALAAGGWTVQNGNLTKDGKQYPLTLKVDPSGDPSSRWGIGIVGQIDDVLGVTVTLDAATQNKEVVTTGDFQMTISYYLPGTDGPGAIGYEYGKPEPPGSPISAGNPSRVDSPELQELIGTLSAESDPVAQQQLAHEAERIFVDQHYTVPIASYAWTIAYTTKKWAGWPDEQNPRRIPAAGRGDLTATILALDPAT